MLRNENVIEFPVTTEAAPPTNSAVAHVVMPPPPLPSNPAPPATATTTRTRPNKRESADVVCLADVKSVRPKFLWDPYVPLDCLTMCEGEPGAKKSFLALQLAADVTKGRSILGTDPTLPPRNVLLLSAEDDLGATVKKRLDAMDADQKRVIAVKRDLNLVQDADRDYFESLLRKHSPALVVVDTMSVYLQVADSKARPALSKLASLARKYKTAILMVRHLRKAGGTSINRGYGSIHYIGAVRSAIAVVRNPLDPAQAVVHHFKSNLTEVGPLVVFGVEKGALARIIDSPLTPQDLLKPRQQEKSEEARAFLRGALADGRRPAQELKDEAMAVGISHATLRRAKDGIGIVVHKGGVRGPWTWELPANFEDAQA